MKQEKFKIADYPTEKALWQRLGTAIRLLNEGAEEPVPVTATMGRSSLDTARNASQP
jgi:hypothetical protein